MYIFLKLEFTLKIYKEYSFIIHTATQNAPSSSYYSEE